MSDPYKEQHPLLCDDLSEDPFNPYYQRRFRPMLFRGRARSQAKGATNIIYQWPEYWTSSVTHWWIGLAMVTLTVFIIYNSVIVFAYLPTIQSKPIRVQTVNKIDNAYNGTSTLPEVFMHVLVNTNEEINMNKYLPYIDIISNKYLEFKYNLIIVLNDTDINTVSAEENNEIAFKSLWSKEYAYKKNKVNNRNIYIKHVTLSNYMNGSPLKKYWRHVPQQFVKFLLRAVSVWDKGGIAFDPTILTPHSPHPFYTEKLESLIQKYRKCNESNSHENKRKKEKPKKKVNNIQDIIEILEHNDDPYNSSQYTPTEAETNDQPLVIDNGQKIFSTEEHLTNSNNDQRINKRFLADVNNKVNYIPHEVDPSAQGYEVLTPSLENNKTSKLSLLPLFLEFLFHDKAKNKVQLKNIENTTSNILTRTRKSVIPVFITKKNVSGASTEFNNTKGKYDEYKPMIISAKGIVHDRPVMINNSNDIPTKCDRVDQLTIDLKGNILATETPCHAFIGTVFSNVIHHTEEEVLNDFIIAELSIFCKGLLSSCKGIDVILL